jgi:hypothetical protein
MSFYGQVLYEFTKLFSQITVGDKDLIADRAWDKIEIKEDPWIKISANDDSGIKEIIFTHGALSSEEVDPTKSIPSFTIINESANATQLNYDDKITVSDPKFDEKGHLVEVSTKDYIMPKQLNVKTTLASAAKGISPNEDNTLYIMGDSCNENNSFLSDGGSWINVAAYSEPNGISIAHNSIIQNLALRSLDPNNIFNNTISTLHINNLHGINSWGTSKPDNGITYTKLSPGEYITVPQVVYDDCGHLLGTKEVGYKLPLTETDE